MATPLPSLAERSNTSTTRPARPSSSWPNHRLSRRTTAPSRLHRVLHWTVALFFFLALFTGFGIYLPWLFRWFTPIFGGGQLSRILHPYFGVAFVFFFALQVLNWFHPCFGRRPIRAGCAT